MIETIELEPRVYKLAAQYSQLSHEHQAQFNYALLNPAKFDQRKIENSKSRFTIHTAHDAFLPQPPAIWVIEHLISAGSFNIIVGEPGCGKTYLMLSAGVCVAIGKSWLGQTTKQCRVLFIDEESGERRLSRRLCEVIRGELGDENAPIDFISLAQFKADTSEDVAKLEELIRDHKYQLVIIDALADIMTGDENSKQDTQPVLNALRQVAIGTNTAIVLIHHTNKLGGYRGSSAIKGAVDLMLLVKADREKNLVYLEVEKSRDCEPIKISAELKWDQDAFWAVQTGGVLANNPLSEAEQAVYHFLLSHGPTSVPEIQQGVKPVSDSSAKKAVYGLADKKIIRRINMEQTGRGAVAIYEVTPDNNERING